MPVYVMNLSWIGRSASVAVNSDGNWRVRRLNLSNIRRNSRTTYSYLFETRPWWHRLAIAFDL